MKNPLMLLPLAALLAVSVFAAEHIPDPAAKAEFEKARAMGMGEAKAAVAAYRKAIEIDPDYYSAHQYYILYYSIAATQSVTADDQKKAASEKAHKELEEQYKTWAAKHPDKAVYQWALGEICDYENPDQAVRYYQQAVKIDPTYGPAYDMLGISAEEHGDLELSREYERKAHEAWPNDVTLWRHYMGAWVDADFNKAKQIVLDMAQKFPSDGVSMLGYLAGRTTDENEARGIYEMVIEKFPKAAAGSTTPLFGIYLKSDPNKALDLASSMVKNNPTDKTWPVLKDYAAAVIEANARIAEGKAADALAALDKIKLPRYGADPLVLDLTRAKALDASGDTAKAYASLAKIVANSPSDEARAALRAYGKKLGKDSKQVDADIWAQLDAAAKPGIPFSLVSYATGKPVSTDQYKGRVFLVNFWYPKCGPCRGEFPYLEQSLEKFKSRGFDILAINGHPPEDEWVMPLIKGWKLGFLPLKGTDEVIKAYKVRGFPSNFLYGPDGRIYPMPAQVRPATMRQFQLQVEELLQKTKESDVTGQ